MVKEYKIPVINYVNFKVNLTKIYNKIKEEYPDAEDDEVYNIFGDSIAYYINETKKVPALNEMNSEVDGILDEVWYDFGEWLKTKK